MKGVRSTKVGYTGGTTKNPTYEKVCSGTTGHAESVEVFFDPKVIPYEQLLEEFFRQHDAAVNKTGHGGQYRSVIFYHNEEQAEIARKLKARLEKQQGRPLSTEIVPATTFNTAEDYHQNYYKKRGSAY